MYINQIIELSMVLDNGKFHKVLNRAYSQATNIDENGNEVIDQSVADKGFVITYRDSQYKKKIKLIVNTSLILDFETLAHDKLIRKLEKRISEYFHSEYLLDDFTLSGMILMLDINVGSQEQVSAYVKVLQRIGKVKGFSPSSFEGIDESISFCLDGKSNSIDFLIYDLTGAIVERHRNTGASQKKLKSIIEKSEGILRVEVRLTKPKAIRVYTDETDAAGQIAVLAKNSQDIFLDIFTRIVPFGDFYKKDAAIELIQKEVKDVTLRRRMLRLVALIPEKKSLMLAQKALNYRRINDVMKAFAEINVSPVTISKRNNMKYLKCFYSYLFDEKQ